VSDERATMNGRDWKRKRHARDARFCKLGYENASARRCKGSAVGVRIRVLCDAALVVVRLEGAVGRVDERARLHRVDDSAAGFGVQRGLRVVHHVDPLKRVDFAAFGPIWRLRPEGRPDGTLTEGACGVSTSIDSRRVRML
jgi:hypothetical protein